MSFVYVVNSVSKLLQVQMQKFAFALAPRKLQMKKCKCKFLHLHLKNCKCKCIFCICICNNFDTEFATYSLVFHHSGKVTIWAKFGFSSFWNFKVFKSLHFVKRCVWLVFDQAGSYFCQKMCVGSFHRVFVSVSAF